MCDITSTSRMQLNSMLGAMGLSENQLRKEKLTTSATFLLLRLVRNLKGSQVGPCSDINCLHHMSSSGGQIV